MVVNLCQSGRDPKEVATELDLTSSMIYRWMREHNAYGSNSFKGNGNAVMTAEQEEISRLKAALKQSEIEREILKKVVSIFSRSDNRNTSL